MSDHYRATPEDWKGIERAYFFFDRCLLELRARIELLEATQHAHADTSGLSNEERNAVAEQLREPGGFQPFKVETSYGEASAKAKDLLRRSVMVEGSFELHGTTYKYKAEASPAANAQKLTLVDRMADLIDPDEAIAARGTARAAVRVVAEWLRSEYPQREGYGTAWADLLDSEASR